MDPSNFPSRMDVEFSSFLENDSGAPGDGGKRKRLCTGFSDYSQPQSTFYTQWASSETHSEPTSSAISRHYLEVQARSTAAVDFGDVSRQRVGNIQDQTLFQSHPNAPSQSHSSCQSLQSSLVEVVGATRQLYHQATDVQASLHPASNTYNSPHPSDSTFLHQPTAKSNIPHGSNSSDPYQLPDIGAACQNGFPEPTSDGSPRHGKSGDNEHKHISYEICFGLVGQIDLPRRVCGARAVPWAWSSLRTSNGRLNLVQINTAKLRVSSATLETIPAGRAIVKLNVQGPMTTVHSVHQSGKNDYMGLLDQETASTLEQICQEHDVDIRAYILHDRKSDSKNGSVTWGADIPIYIVLFGHSQDSELIGQSLSESSIFLQHPRYKGDLELYKNPQYLLAPGEEYPKIDCIDADSSSSWNDPLSERATLNEIRLDSIFDSARGPEEYSFIEPSPRLCTKLQPHQEKGLAMMNEKERGILQENDFTPLWSQTSSSSGRSWYRNCVTGAVKENPILCLGGLLADEMGLGKSLTVIALIAGTLDSMATQSTGQNRHRPLLEAEQCNRITLIISPKSTLHSWKEQFDKHTNGRIQVCYYTGKNRKSTVPAFLGYDVVVTTYGTVTAERNRRVKESCDEDQPLLASHWLRLVLDEAHVIRNASTKQCATVCALKARHRWCLSGTPIQNVSITK